MVKQASAGIVFLLSRSGGALASRCVGGCPVPCSSATLTQDVMLAGNLEMACLLSQICSRDQQLQTLGGGKASPTKE